MAIVFLAAAPVQAQLVGTDTSAGDPCTTKGATRRSADPDFDGKEVTFICDGSEWQPETPAAAGNAGEIQFNSGGELAALDTFKYLTGGDFVVGSPQLDADGNASHDSRVFFDKSKAAFRAGYGADPFWMIDGGNAVWNDANVGSQSVAFGYYTEASGAYSAAIGRVTVASGEASMATGVSTTASGSVATAMGKQTTASGQYSTALGRYAIAGDGTAFNGKGDGSFAFGLVDNAVVITAPPQVTGIQSYGIFMDDQEGVVLSSANTMGLFGGRLVIDPAVPATDTVADAPLDVNGEIKFSSSGLACDGNAEGSLRWNGTEKTVEMCDGSNWRMIAATTAATDCTPDAFSFTDLTSQSLNSLILSETLNITGIDPGCTVSVTGSGSPEISVNGGAWVGATTMDAGDSLRVRQISSNAVSTARVAAVEVGDTTDNWSVTTKAGQTRVFRTTGDYIGGAIGGLAGADSICQTEAGNRGYSGTWKALLSDSTTNAKDRVTIAYPVVRATDGVVIDSTNLWDGSLEAEISSISDPVWTGTFGNGTNDDANTCGDWADNGVNGQFGKAPVYTTYGWISSGTEDCSWGNALYCVDQ